MIEARRGVILNIVATYAWHGGPGTMHSACAKAGVLAMTRTLAVEWARHGIRVVALAPGPLATEGASDRLWPSPEMEERVLASIPLGRFATLGEVAEAGAYLVSDHAAYWYITGDVLTIDGGGWLGRGVLGHASYPEIPSVRRRRRAAPGGSAEAQEPVYWPLAEGAWTTGMWSMEEVRRWLPSNYPGVYPGRLRPARDGSARGTPAVAACRAPAFAP